VAGTHNSSIPDTVYFSATEFYENNKTFQRKKGGCIPLGSPLKSTHAVMAKCPVMMIGRESSITLSGVSFGEGWGEKTCIPGSRHDPRLSKTPINVSSSPRGREGQVLHTAELVVCALFHIAVLLHKGPQGGRLCPRGLLFDKILLKNDKKCS